ASPLSTARVEYPLSWSRSSRMFLVSSSSSAMRIVAFRSASIPVSRERSNLPNKVRSIVRLVDDYWSLPQRLHQLAHVVYISRAVDDFHVAFDFAQSFAELCPSHLRHDEVCEHDVDQRTFFLENLNGVHPIGCLDGCAPRRFQHYLDCEPMLRQDCKGPVLVVCNVRECPGCHVAHFKSCPATTCCRGNISVRLRARARFCLRQISLASAFAAASHALLVFTLSLQPTRSPGRLCPRSVRHSQLVSPRLRR